MTVTLGGVITEVNSLCENSFTDAQKTRWVDQLESKIFAEILLISEADYDTLAFDVDEDNELKVDSTHDEIYVTWLAAQIAFWLHETSEYNQFIAAYNVMWRNYEAFIAFTYAPADFRNATGSLYYLRQKGSVLVTDNYTITYANTSGTAYLIDTIPSDCIITAIVVDITGAFNSSGGDVVIVGTADDDDYFMDAGDIDETVVNNYKKEFWERTGALGLGVYIKWTGTGVAATTGIATINIQYVQQ